MFLIKQSISDQCVYSTFGQYLNKNVLFCKEEENMMKDLFIGRCIKDQFVILEMSVEKKAYGHSSTRARTL